MKASFHKPYTARKDLTGIFRYYVREAGVSVARRFSTQADATFRRLAEMPGMGAPYDSSYDHLTDLRFFPVLGFEKYLVFYRLQGNSIEITRILHSARNIEKILENLPTN